MVRLGDAMKPNRTPTSTENEAIERVRELVLAFDVGSLPAEEVRRLCTGPERWLTIRFTPPDHVAFQPMMRLADALIDANGMMRTRHGCFSRDDIAAVEAKIERKDGQELIVFPVRHPWLVKPDREKGIPGVRAPAIYRAASERGPMYKPLDQAPKPIRIDLDRLWWQDQEE